MPAHQNHARDIDPEVAFPCGEIELRRISHSAANAD